ncbi:hypothetical protein ABZX95_17425 [Streptomyces sp. NPDC004232]|uniref:hypothetical protein n=1 Tax=Streptomyces sp. NPDC004232 TaxID=3154454 RepID=UPI0033AC72E5
MSTQPATTTRTRRGDLAVIERTHVTHSTATGRTETTEYTVMVVCSVTRDGRAKAVRDDRYPSDGHNVAYPQPLDRMLGLRNVLIVSKADIDVPAAIATARAHTYPDSTTPRAYESLDAVRDALRPHLVGGGS